MFFLERYVNESGLLLMDVCPYPFCENIGGTHSCLMDYFCYQNKFETTSDSFKREYQSVSLHKDVMCVHTKT